MSTQIEAYRISYNMKVRSRSLSKGQGHQRSKYDVIRHVPKIQTFVKLKDYKNSQDDRIIYLLVHSNTIQHRAVLGKI